MKLDRGAIGHLQVPADGPVPALGIAGVSSHVHRAGKSGLVRRVTPAASAFNLPTCLVLVAYRCCDALCWAPSHS